VSAHDQPAHDLTARGDHKARVKWMQANGIKTISTAPSGATMLAYDDGRVAWGTAADLLPVHLRPQGS
jgi:hypothetical protein